MATPKPYTQFETNRIVEVFNKKNNLKERAALAKELGRDITALSQKATYERKRINGTLPKKGKDSSKSQKTTPIVVTHVNKNIGEGAFIKIDNAEVKITSKKFTVNGVRIEF